MNTKEKERKKKRWARPPRPPPPAETATTPPPPPPAQTTKRLKTLTQQGIKSHTIPGHTLTWLSQDSDRITGLGEGWTEGNLAQYVDSGECLEELDLNLASPHPSVFADPTTPASPPPPMLETRVQAALPPEAHAPPPPDPPDDPSAPRCDTEDPGCPVRMLTWNPRGVYSEVVSLSEMASEGWMAIIASDTHLRPRSHRAQWLADSMPGYKLFFNSPDSGSAHAGVMIGLAEEYAEHAQQLPLPSRARGRLIGLRITQPGWQRGVTLIGAYAPHPTSPQLYEASDGEEEAPPEQAYLEELEQMYAGARARGDWVVIAGDHNAVTSEGDRSSGALHRRDVEWKEWLGGRDLRMADRLPHADHMSYTADNNKCVRSRIDDFIIHAPDLEVTTVVRHGEWTHGSDHEPVEATFHNLSAAAPKPLEPRADQQTHKRRLNLPADADDRHSTTERLAHDLADDIERITALVQGDTMQPADMEEAERVINRVLSSSLDVIEEMWGTTKVLERSSPKKGARPFLPRSQAEEYKHHMTLAKSMRALTRYMTSQSGDGDSPKIDDVAIALAEKCQLNHSLRDTPPTEMGAFLASTLEASQRHRNKGRAIVHAHHKKRSQNFVKKWQHILDTRTKVGHRCIFEAGKPKHNLQAVKIDTGQISTKAEDVIHQTEKHFSTVQEATISAEPAKIWDFPWERGDSPMTLTKGGNMQPLMDGYDEEMYWEHLRRLPNGKAAGPDEVPNEVLKLLPLPLHSALARFMKHIGRAGRTPDSWKTSHTVLLYKKGDPTVVKNYRPIGLARTLYKLWTSIVTELMSTYAEERGMLHEPQEGFRKDRNTERQLQLLLAILEDAKVTQEDVYLLYIDFTNAFGSVDHPRVMAILDALGFPPDCVNIVRDLYTNARTAFITPAGLTKEIPLHRGNIQGDALSPLVFLCFIEPLLRWLEHDKGDMYKFGTSQTRVGAAAYADDLAVATNTDTQMRRQLHKVAAYQEWGMLEVNVPKCGLTAAFHKTGVNLKEDKNRLHRLAHTMRYNGGTLPVLGAKEPYRYLGVMTCAALNWNHQRAAITSKVADSSQRIAGSWARPDQQKRSLRQVVVSQARYGMVAAPYSNSDMAALGAVIHYAMKKSLGLPTRGLANGHLYNPITEYGVGLDDLLSEYNKKLVDSLQACLQDEGRIGAAVAGLAKWYHERGIRDKSWVNMGPVARKVATAWQAGIQLGGAVPPRPGLIGSIAGKSTVDWDWGILRKLTESDIVPLLDMGVLTLDMLTTPDGGSIMSIDAFKQVYPKVKGAHVAALRKLREALCETSLDDSRPAKLKEAKQHANPPPLSWKTGVEPAGEGALCVIRKKGKKRKRRLQPATDLPPPADDAPLEPARQLHRVRRAGPRLQYEVEWEDSWTDGHDVAPSGVHNVTEGAASPHTWEIEQVLDTRVDMCGNKTYKVKWKRTWEWAESLIPPGMSASPLICDFYNDRLRRRCEVSTEPTRPGRSDAPGEDEGTPDPPTGSPPPDVRSRVKVVLDDLNPDTDIRPPGKTTLSLGRTGEERIVFIHDPDGRMSGQLTEERVAQLWHRYNIARELGMHGAKVGSFPEELSALVKRYKTGHRGDGSATGKVKMTNHWALPNEYMQAVHNILRGRVERFASPLNVHWDTTTYYTAFKQDAVFGATYNAYRCTFAGGSEANPEYESGELSKTLKWAIQSTYTDEPVCTMLVYPDWKAEDYQTLLLHPRVHVLYTVPQPHFSFDTPEKFTGIPNDKAHNAHWEVLFIMVANIQGLRDHFDATAVEQLPQATRLLAGHTGTLTLPSVAKLEDIRDGEHLLSSPPDAPPNPPPSSVCVRTLDETRGREGLRALYTTEGLETVATPHDVYTDGSLKQKGVASGAGVYCPGSGKKYTIRYSGKKSIHRAELLAILVALRNWEKDAPVRLYSDSRNSLLDIRRTLARKGNAKGLKEAPILREIYALLVERTAPTNLTKVRAHVGIVGNECADRLAVDSADGKPHAGATHVEVDTPEETGVANIWLTTDGSSPATDPGNTRRTFDHENRVAAERHNAHPIFCRMADIPGNEPVLSNAFATSKEVTHANRAWVWKARFNAVATRKRLAQWGKLGPGQAKCIRCASADDTVGHRLGGCPADPVSGLATKRHDWAVKRLVRAHKDGARAGYHIEYNAGTLEDGSTHKMIHDRFLLPRTRARSGQKRKRNQQTVPIADREQLGRLKPDIIIYQGIRPGNLQDHIARDCWPRNFKIQILEVGYSNDWLWEEKRKEKAAHYAPLVAHMRGEGWDVDIRYAVLGVRGVVYSNLLETLQWLGVKDKTHQKTALRQIALHGANMCASMLRACARADAEAGTRTDGGARG
jgi:ribonuclease HI/exonuclease III